MHPRVLLALVLVSAGLLGAVLLTAGATGDDGRVDTTGFAGAVRPAIPPTEPVGLRTQDGEGVSLRALRGRPVVVTFLYTTCADTCPLTARQIAGALDRLGAEDGAVPVLAVSVDPANDTPARAKAFLRRMRLEGRADFLLGDAAALRRQWRAYGMQPQTDALEHSGHTVLLDGRGVQRVGWPAEKLTPEGLARDLRTLAADSVAAPAALAR